MTKCDLTHKRRYFDGKLESGGGSHEMKEIIVSLHCRWVKIVTRVYTTNMVAMESKDYEWRTPDASRSNFQPARRKCTMTVVLPLCPRCLNNVKSVSIAIHKDSIAQITCISSPFLLISSPLLSFFGEDSLTQRESLTTGGLGFVVLDVHWDGEGGKADKCILLRCGSKCELSACSYDK